jgi:hypothetical protein
MRHAFLALSLVAALTAQRADAAVVLTFQINGDTFGVPFSITNNSTAGEKVTGFHLNLAPTGTFFDTADSAPGFPGSIPFSPVGSSGVLTGLVSSPSVPDGSTLLDLAFNGFDPGETFSFDLDVDRPNTATVYGNELIGALVSVDFSNGFTASGTLAAVAGSPLASRFVVEQVIPTPSVPEPASIVLIGAAAPFGLIAWRRRRKVSAA